MPITSKFGKLPDTVAKYVRATNLADSDHASVRKQANDVVKDVKTTLQAVQLLHEFVAGLPQGYDREDSKASFILKKMRGQCNTKTTLFIALCRAVKIPTRIHSWYVYKTVHKHHMPVLVYWFTSKTTIFTYPEVYYKGKWQLLGEVLAKSVKPSWDTCPFDDAKNRKHPLKGEWIYQDLGSDWHPDIVYKKYGTNADGWRRAAFPIAQLLLN